MLQVVFTGKHILTKDAKCFIKTKLIKTKSEDQLVYFTPPKVY